MTGEVSSSTDIVVVVLTATGVLGGLLWLACAVLVGILAAGRYRSGFGWFFVSMIVSPFVGLLALMIATDHGFSPQPTMSANRSGWTCANCKLENTPGSLECERCGAGRG